MKKIIYTLFCAAAAASLTGCSDSFNVKEAAGEGRLLLRPSVSTDMKQSRAVDSDELQRLGESCTIWISSERGLVRKYDGIQNVPADGIWLTGGLYTAEAWAGDSVPASFDSRYFKGVEKFSINAGGTVQVDLKCGIANSAVSVKYAESVADVLSDYTMTVGHSCGELTWNGQDYRRGYFMMNSRDKDLTYKLEGTRQDGSNYKLEGKIEAVKPATEYVLNVKYNGTDVETGGAFFTIEIDESTVDVTDEIVIIPAPSIIGVYQSLDEPVYGEAGKMTRQGVFVSAATELKSVLVSAPALAELIGIEGGEFDLIRADASVLENLSAKGVKSFRQRDAEADLDNIKITFEPELLNQLGDGEYEITVTATVTVPVDENKSVDKTNAATLKIIVSDADVEAEKLPMNSPLVWATEATITGKVMKDGLETVGFKYREQGASEWIAVDNVESRAALAKGSFFTAVLTGLKPGTTYEYVATAGAFTSTIVNTFTTEEARQLPNCGFEDWYIASGNRKPYYIASSDDDSALFWDSGNHGSAGMGKNITTPDEAVKHSGNYSIKMSSQFVGIGSIGAFAAGNVFAGKFLGTENTTKGILGWGRPWNTRPRALRGYVKYNPAAITHVTGTPEGVTVNVGDMDAGIVYVGIVDESTMTYGNYGPWPQMVATKDINKYSFKSTAPSVIAYGCKLFTEATPGEGMIEFEIPIEYFKSDVKAANIIVVASASQYGDYYTGGPSVMYLDDLELVY